MTPLQYHERQRSSSISAHSGLMYYSYSLPGVEWTAHTIGGDEILVGGARHDARLNSCKFSRNGLLVLTYNW